jgi:hypothetical protein
VPGRRGYSSVHVLDSRILSLKFGRAVEQIEERVHFVGRRQLPGQVIGD